MSDYLWDKSGEPDAEVERLEELLGQLRHRPRAFDLPSDAPAVRAPQRRPRPLFFRPAYAAAAAAVLMLLAGLWLGLVGVKHQGQGVVVEQTPSAQPQRGEGVRGADAVAQLSQASNETVKGGGPSEVSAARPVEGGRPKRRPAASESVPASRRARASAPLKNTDIGLALPAGVESQPGAGGGEGRLLRAVARVGEERRRVKQELLYALRLTGSKLNLAQQRVLGNSSPARPSAREDF